MHDHRKACAQENMAAAEAWQAQYHKTAKHVAAVNNASSWAALDTASIFAHLDVFVQRCGNLRGVALAQLQFCPMDTSPPAFGGCYAPELSKRIADIQVKCVHKVCAAALKRP